MDVTGRSPTSPKPVSQLNTVCLYLIWHDDAGDWDDYYDEKYACDQAELAEIPKNACKEIGYGCHNYGNRTGGEMTIENVEVCCCDTNL